MSMNITITHDDKEYTGILATIDSTHLGWEDHGIWTAMMQCSWESAGIGVGGWALDKPVKDTKEHVTREGTAFGMDQVITICNTVGVNTWEKLKGSSVVVLFPKDDRGSRAVGIAGVHNSKVLIFQEHCDAWKVRDLS